MWQCNETYDFKRRFFKEKSCRFSGIWGFTIILFSPIYGDNGKKITIFMSYYTIDCDYLLIKKYARCYCWLRKALLLYYIWSFHFIYKRRPFMSVDLYFHKTFKIYQLFYSKRYVAYHFAISETRSKTKMH